jgi:hypothetical protein
MRQASWIAFLLLTLGLVGYEAALDRQDQTTQVTSEEEPALDGSGGMPGPTPKP